MSQLKASLIVVSDIHLSHSDDERAQKFLPFLARIERGEVDSLVLLGDIFDFCLGSHSYFQEKFAAIGRALERVAASGTRVVYLEGNHEFRLKDLPWKGIEVIPGGTVYIPLKNGQLVQAAHGDMIYSHRRYKVFRWAVKSRFVTGVARLFPGTFLDHLTRKTSEVSRSADEYRPIYHDKILDAVDVWMESQREPAQYGIFGHFHVPYAEPRRDLKEGAVLSVDSWDKPNALVFKAEGIYRCWLEGVGKGEERWEPVAPLVRPALMRPGYPEIRV
ncbi:MAG: metallophosphoesterase [Chitinophagaceae bacterium]|nr:metallophosphoesterase [Oligoflexus sp.]